MFLTWLTILVIWCGSKFKLQKTDSYRFLFFMGGNQPCSFINWIWQKTFNDFDCEQKLIFYCSTNLMSQPQFYIQLVYRPQFGTWILLFGPFGQLRAARKKKWIWVFLSNFWGWFFQLFVVKKIFKIFLKTF